MAKAVQPQKIRFSQAIQTPLYKNLVNNTLGDPVRAGRFIANITSAVAVNAELQKCDPGTILAGALLGESLFLQPSPQLGQFYLVPFKSKAKYDREGQMIEPEKFKAQFVLGYKGYIQLALRTGQYKRLNVLEVKNGELSGWDPFEERFHEMHFIEDFEKRMSMPTIGYIAHFEYINGFQKTLYWTADQMMSHADKYSPAFSAAAYKKLLNGEIPQNELWKYSSFWYKDFDGMAKKTMLRQLISKWGIMTAEMTMAYERDGHVMMPDTASGDLLPEVTDTPELGQQDEQEQPKIERTAKTMDLPEPEADEVKSGGKSMISAYKELYAKLPTQFQLESYEESCLGDYVCDTQEDLKNLPNNCTMGSTARVISPLAVYKRNSTGKWVLQETINGEQSDGS